MDWVKPNRRGLRVKAVAYGIMSLFMAGWLLACTDDLIPRRTADLIEDHIRSVAPDVLLPYIMSFEIKETLVAGEHSRGVRLSVAFRVDPKIARSKKTSHFFDHPIELIAFFQRSDKGWVLARYGEPMKSMMARLWHFQIRSLYSNLVGTVSKLGIEASRWEGERVVKLRSHQPVAWGEYLSGIPEIELIHRTISNKVKIPIGVEWGVLSAPNSRFYSVIWAKLLSDPSVICARRIGSRAEDRYPPLEFNWLSETTRVKCRGRRIDFNPYTATRDGLELIKKSGGLLPPFRKS